MVQIEDCIGILHEQASLVYSLFCWVRLGFTMELYPKLQFANVHFNFHAIFLDID